MRVIIILTLLFTCFKINSQEILKDSSVIDYSILPINNSPKLKLAFLKLQKIYKNKTKNNYSSGDSIFTIIHIGDSHIQGDHFSGQIRKQLQSYFGNGGRGVLFPYALAKSFGPRGTILKTNKKWIGEKTLTPNLSNKLGFIGYAAFTNDSNSSIALNFTENFEDSPFKKINIWHSSDSTSYAFKLNNEFKFSENKLNPSGWGISSFYCNTSTNTFSIFPFKTNTKQNHFGFYGFELISDIKYGVNYHHCGVVGAQFTHLINNAPWSIEQIAHLNPDLIIFSFGTNEAYNKDLDTSFYKSSIIKFMHDLEIASPKTAFIFTTAPDTRSQNRIPSNQISVNSLIKKIVDSGNYSIFDLNEAMGGWGSIYTWYNKGLTLKDKLHFTEQGYSLQANLFTLSLLEAYNLINFNDSINLNQIRSIVKDTMVSILRNSKNDSLIKILEAHNKKQSIVSKNSTNRIHIVKKGDTISKLCRIYKISQKIILNTNNLSKKSILKIGEKIIITK